MSVPSHSSNLPDANHHPDMDAFNRLFHLFYPMLVLFARRMVHDKQVAEDIVAEVFFKLWKRGIRFHCQSTAKAFLYISTRNACVNHLQQAGFQAGVRAQLGYLHRDDAEQPVMTEIIRSEVLREIRALLDMLPRQCRTVMQLSYLSGMTNEEIANRLQVSIHTVRNQKARGIMLLRRKLLPPAILPADLEIFP